VAHQEGIDGRNQACRGGHDNGTERFERIGTNMMKKPSCFAHGFASLAWLSIEPSKYSQRDS
jgi:hypothetical protein